MNAFEIALIAWIAFGTLSTVGIVGKDRDPITPGQAIFVIIVNTAVIIGLIINAS